MFRYYTRVGRYSGISTPFWFYALFVLPVQLLWWFAVAMAWLVAATVALALFAAREIGYWWQRRRGEPPERA